MELLSWLILLLADPPVDALAKKMLPVYLQEASEYSFAVESAPKQPLELRKEPIFEWSNPVRSGVQQGVVYVWLHNGRPSVFGCIFSEPEGQLRGRKVIHEFHALDTEKLLVSRPDAYNEWKPQAGLSRKDLDDSGTPAAAAGSRLVQMRKLAQEFSGYSVDHEGKRWDLRLMPAPLYRYPAAQSGTVDGAIFTLVSTAGTDPEVVLLIEAREQGGKLHWEYACGRFSDLNLHVVRQNREVWTSIRDENNTFLHDALHTYRTYADKVVSLDGKLLAHVRTSPKIWWGEFIRVHEK